MEHEEAFSKLIEALRPWLGHLVFVGGWAHRLHRLHPLATPPSHRPLVTRDADLAMAPGARIVGNIGEALEQAGFVERFVGSDSPPVTHYELGEESDGFYAEFLTSLRGDGFKRNGEPDVAVAKAGITVQKVRHMDLLLVEPWTVDVRAVGDAAAGVIQLRLPNAVSFIVHKLLIHNKRKGPKKAQDLLYIHDTLELFGGSLENLAALWRNRIRSSLPAKQAKGVVSTAHEMFEGVTDVIRGAARIPQDRQLSPETLRGACEYGLQEILADAAHQAGFTRRRRRAPPRKQS